MPCKNKLDVLYFVVACFTWLLRASSKNCSYLRIKTTTVIYQVCCFNLQQGPAVVKFDSTKVGKQTPASHLYAKQVACLSVEQVSWTWSCKVGPGRLIQQYRRIKVRRCWYAVWLLSPTTLCVLLVHITSTHRPGPDATVGEHSISKKLPTIMQDLSRRSIATSGKSVPTYPRRPKAEAFSNAVDVVEHLRYPTDPSGTSTFSSVTSLELLI